MRITITLKLIFFLSLLYSGQTLAQDKSPSNEKSKGQKIGEVINDAFQAAFPSIDGIFKIIGKITNSEDSEKKKKNPQEQNQDEKLKKEVESYQTTLRNEANKELRRLTQFSNQLLLLDKFLQPGVKIQAFAAEMTGILSKRPQLTQSDWAEIKNRHSKIMAQMAKITTIPEDNINTFFQGDVAIRTALLDVKGANENVIVDINTYVDAKNGEKLGNSTQELLRILQHITAIVGLKLVDLQLDFKAIGEQGAQGADDAKKVSGVDSVYKNVLEVKLKK